MPPAWRLRLHYPYRQRPQAGIGVGNTNLGGSRAARTFILAPQQGQIIRDVLGSTPTWVSGQAPVNTETSRSAACCRDAESQNSTPAETLSVAPAKEAATVLWQHAAQSMAYLVGCRPRHGTGQPTTINECCASGRAVSRQGSGAFAGHPCSASRMGSTWRGSAQGPAEAREGYWPQLHYLRL